LQRDH
jgi:hypothetical protein